MQLTTANTAIVLDSTADFPDAPQRHPNFRVVPLYVRFGEDSYRDYVDLGAEAFYDRLRSSTETPASSQPTPGDFLETYEELAAYERVLVLTIASTLSGTFGSAEAAAGLEGSGRVRVLDSKTASAAVAMLALAIQRRLGRGATDEEVDALVARYHDEAGPLFTVSTLEYLARGGGVRKAGPVAGKLVNGKTVPPTPAGGGRRRTAADREADPRDPRGRRRAGQARAREREGVRGVQVGVRGGDDGRREPARRHRACRGAGPARGADEPRPARAAAGDDRHVADAGPGDRPPRRPRHGRFLRVPRPRLSPRRPRQVRFLYSAAIWLRR